MKKKVILWLVLISFVNFAVAAPTLIPEPKESSFTKSTFAPKRIVIAPEQSARNEIGHLLKIFKSAKIPATVGKSSANVVFIKTAVNNPHKIDGAYELTISPKKVVIKADDSAGFFYAVQTIRQLLEKRQLPCGTVKDWPAFKVRGFMHDVGRNFLPMEILKEHAEMMTLYKMNTFHLHLTDYPGYRLESKKFPILNAPSTGEKNRQPGKFYTVKEMRNFIQFCKKRHITVIPEIDMPGHSAYFKRAFKTDMQSDKGVKILEELIKEVVQIFPKKDCPYLHIGSDEVRIYRKNFMQEMTELIRQTGHEVIYWRPGGNPTDNQVITQLWTGSAKPLPGMRYIDSRATYLNHMDPLGGILRLYFMQPCWVENAGKDPNALGSILCSWCDNVIDAKKGSYGVYDITPIYAPLVTYSQNLWRGRRDDNVTQFLAQMPAPDSEEFKEFKAFERKLLQHRNRFFRGKHFQYVEQTEIPWNLLVVNNKDLPAVETEVKASAAAEYGNYKWNDKPVIGGTVHLQHFFGFQSVLNGIGRDNTVFAQTYVYSPKNQKVQWWIQFGTPSSSGRRNGANPKPDEWNYYGADLWINGNRPTPPEWQNPRNFGSQQAGFKVPFTNEGYFYRKPTDVLLKKGWNRVLLKVPGSSDKKAKWMFTCIPVKTSGRDVREVKGLKFSTQPKK